MNFKKIIALFLILGFTGFYPVHISSAENKEETLYEFINKNKNFTATFEYPSYVASVNALGKKVLPAHTPVVIRSSQEINTDNIKSGDNIVFVVAQDVVDANNNVLVKMNTPVNANIEFEKRELIGRSAKIIINDFHTKAVDGTYIPLSTVITEAPDDKMVLSIVLSVCVCPLFLFMKGKDAKIPANTVKTIYTINDTYINTTTL